MSLVYITHHNENVYDYEQSGFFATPVPKKRIKYISKHKTHVKKQVHQSYVTEDRNGVKLITDWGKHERRTMGCAHTPLNPPKCFLRKNEGLKWRRLHDHVCPPSKKMEPVPRRSQMPKKPCGPQRKTPRKKQEKQDKQENAVVTDRSVKSSKTAKEKPSKTEGLAATDRSVKSSKPAKEKPSKTEGLAATDRSVKSSKATREKQSKAEGLTASNRSVKSSKATRENQSKPEGLPSTDRSVKSTTSIREKQVDPCETCESERERQKQDKLKTLLCPCPIDRSIKSETVIKTAQSENQKTRGNPETLSNKSVKSRKSQASKLQKRKQESSGLTDRSVKSSKSAKSDKTKKSQQSDRHCKHINFIALNRKRAIEAKTKRPPPHFVDTPFGNRQNLLNSGLIPQFVCGKNFAKVPCYINEHKKMLQEFRAKCTKERVVIDPCSKYMAQSGVRKMSVEERVALLEGLKTNYSEQLKIFQALSLYTDTPTKKLRKSRLEKDLQQLEIDIHFLEDNADIYLADF